MRRGGLRNHISQIQTYPTIVCITQLPLRAPSEAHCFTEDSISCSILNCSNTNFHIFNPISCFYPCQILKDNAVKVLHSICQKIWKTEQWPQDWKRSVFIPIPKKGNAKECSNYCTIALISHASKVMLKILQARLQQYVNRELPDVQAGFRKGRGTRDHIANIHWIRSSKNQESSRKTSISALLTLPKPSTVWITISFG